MHTVSPHVVSAAGRSDRRRGFSFIEVLFAVMILGIGFILIAGVFPVAISQTASSQEETIAAGMANSVVSAVSAVPNLQATSVVPANSTVTRLADASISDPTQMYYGAFKGNQINPDDPRYAWIPLIKRNTTDYRGQPPATAELIVVAVEVRGRAAFDARDLVQTGTGDTATGNLMAHLVKVDSLNEGSANADTRDYVLFDKSSPDLGAAAPGAVLVVKNGGVAAGRIYRLAEVDAVNPLKWYLLPGNDMAVMNGANENASSVDAWLVGQGYTDPTKPANGYSGGNMVTGVYVSYISLK